MVSVVHKSYFIKFYFTLHLFIVPFLLIHIMVYTKRSLKYQSNKNKNILVVLSLLHVSCSRGKYCPSLCTKFINLVFYGQCIHEMRQTPNKSCTSQWIIYISLRHVFNPVCLWVLAQCEWSLSFPTNALSRVLLSFKRAEPKPTEPPKEQLQDHRNANCHAPVRNSDQMWTNCPVTFWQWLWAGIHIHTSVKCIISVVMLQLKSPILIKCLLLLRCYHGQYWLK